ncbi:site-specific DNA-methyltransferase [Croceibacterium salegens]|nr:site-specific DNA-methyltransferase [Croceibacterium salegens]
MTDLQRDWPACQAVEAKIADLRPYGRNARTHTAKQIKQIADAIREWGWTSPILITEDRMIVAGHGRVLAAQRLGIETVPAIIANGWSEKQIRAYVIADNKLALNAGWDEKLLAAELEDLCAAGFAVDLIGFSDREFAELVPPGERLLTDPDDIPDTSAQPVCRPCDCWILGDHRLVCGDATEARTYSDLLREDRPQCCWTDPPYNVNYQSSAGSIANDNLKDAEFAEFLRKSFSCLAKALPSGASVYVAHADTQGLKFRQAFEDAGLKLSGVVIWEKNSIVLGRSDYQWKHEPILYGWKPGAAHTWLGNRKQSTISELNGNVFSMNEDGSVVVRVGNETIVIEGQGLSARAIEPTIIRVDRPRASADHPTMKPVQLIVSTLRNSAEQGDIVLDPFAGSGSTIIAAELLELRCRAIELDPHYCDVIIERWQDATGRKAVRG